MASAGSPTRPNFFLPVLVLSRLFRRLMLEKLAAAHKAGKLTFFGEHAHLADAKAFAAFLAPLKRTRWFVYSKRPFAGPKAVLAYLARYTHRVAISNSRLIAADATSVTFKVKDYRVEGPGRYTTMTLAPTSSSAASSSTSCPRASTASATTACSPAALATRTSPRLASYWRAASTAPMPKTRLPPMTELNPRSPPVPLLRRPHGRHRDVRRRLPTTATRRSSGSTRHDAPSGSCRSADRHWRWSQAGDDGGCPLRTLRRRSSAHSLTILPAKAIRARTAPDRQPGVLSSPPLGSIGGQPVTPKSP